MKAVSPALAEKKTQQVARMLLDRIIIEGLHPGSPFGTEAELIAQYQVSRPTLRESLRILESQGVLSLRPGPGGGIIVRRPSIELLSHAMSVFLRLNDVPLAGIIRARMVIEPALVYHAALNGTDAHFDEMERSTERLELALKDDHDVVYRENREFHNIIAKAAANPVLEIFWLTIRGLASGEGEDMKYSDRNRAHIARAHRAILASCRKHDGQTAQSLMVEHLGELDKHLERRSNARNTVRRVAAAKRR